MPLSYLRKSLKYSINILSSSILFFFALSLIKQSLSTHSTTSSHSAVALQNQNELHRSPFLLPNKSPALIFIVIPPCYTCLPFSRLCAENGNLNQYYFKHKSMFTQISTKAKCILASVIQYFLID